MSLMQSYTYGPASGSDPKKIVLMLHGVGSNGQDLIGLAPYLASSLPNTVFVSADAPEAYDMAPMGFQWFSLQNYVPEFLVGGMDKALPVVNEYIDRLLSHYSLQESDLALLGFSQGTMMALHIAPRRKKPLAGVLGYSGMLLNGEALKEDGMNKVPVCLVHGEADDVVPVAGFPEAKRHLESAGFPFEGETIPGLAHSIDDRGMELGAQFLQKILGDR